MTDARQDRGVGTVPGRPLVTSRRHVLRDGVVVFASRVVSMVESVASSMKSRETRNGGTG